MFYVLLTVLEFVVGFTRYLSSARQSKKLYLLTFAWNIVFYSDLTQKDNITNESNGRIEMIPTHDDDDSEIHNSSFQELLYITDQIITNCKRNKSKKERNYQVIFTATEKAQRNNGSGTL